MKKRTALRVGGINFTQKCGVFVVFFFLGHWHRLPRAVVMASSLLELKKHLEIDLSHTVWVCFFAWSFVEPGVGLNNPCGSLLTLDIL